ncbi:SART-1 family-domain-containing protein [Boletus reticuloceps]|uniref:SART-1 family-domain-containing protein n=1 Tax=Boletus reticuloceps TaxID=495285 RepID=A0A8I2YKF1_9AGAM|nr:SART-1 family-domain-containing protein [Boletus reticuloceps]
MEESISLEETNKIRISLGLKPLTEDPAPADDADKQAEENYARQREREAKARETKKVYDKIAKVRNRRELNASLTGATLGDPDGDSEDTLKWVKRAKKREKELARKGQLARENMDNVFQGMNTPRVCISRSFCSVHFSSFVPEDLEVRILDNEEDELQNIEMAEAERVKKNKELKIKRRDYTGYDDEEFEDGRQGMKRSILAKYDEVLEGPHETDFRLGSFTKSTTVKRPETEEGTVSVNRALLSIDYAKNLETHDYLREGDVGFKKPKTKKKRSSRRAPIDNEVPLDANFVDDDELQAALARQRRTKIHKVKKLSPEEIARKIAADRAREQSPIGDGIIKVEEADEGAGDAGLTFDDTSEFVRAISYNPAAVKVEQVEPSVAPPPPKTRSPSRDVSMPEDEAVQQSEASSDPTFGSGMAGTLALLRQQGLVAQPNADQAEREKVQQQRDLWLADYRRMLAQRELDRLQARGGNKDQTTREYENRAREQQESRASLELFKNYKPDVNIVYYDEFGRSLTPKEAWKALSHKFHGKGSGKMKTEKRLKKIAEEKKKEAMASGDTPLSMNKAFQIRQEKTGQAHFVLSVGNRGAVPQASEFLDPQPLSKGKTEKTKSKKKEAAKAAAPQVLDSAGFITLPVPQANDSVSASPVPSGFSSVAQTNGSGSPMPVKPGFSRISSAVDTPSHSSTPVTGERTKVAFGFGAKRKVAEDFLDEPPAKRR